MNRALTAIEFRACAFADAEELARLGSVTFRETFEAVNTRDNMETYVSQTFNLESIRHELTEAGSFFFVAQTNGESLGFCKIRTAGAAAELSGCRPLEIERIYVLKEHIGKGVGKALMEHCHGYADANGYDVIWLGVWENNLPAIAFYKNWGFEFFGQHIFMLGNDAQTDLLMKKQLGK
jgi:diamine N-acetyltransferase